MVRSGTLRRTLAILVLCHPDDAFEASSEVRLVAEALLRGYVGDGTTRSQQRLVGPAGGEDPVDGLAGYDCRSANNMQVTGSPRRLIVT
jgi:hypothetical protein